MVKKHDIKKSLEKSKTDRKQESSDDEDDGVNVFGSDHDGFYAPELDEFGLE